MLRFKYLSKNKVKALPKTAGVYAFKTRKAILYIGKAANIKERVRNHFQQPGFRDTLFIKDTEKIGYVKTGSEIEALLQEATLIKKYQPKFNVLWKDDKNYFYIAITKETLPRVFLTHQPKLPTTHYKLQTRYIGPFVDGKALKQTLRVLRRVFPYRTCGTLPKRPCLWYELGRCPAPCFLNSKLGSQVSGLKESVKRESQYNTRNLVKILQGKRMQVLRNLKKEMQEASKTQEFEKAAKLRDQITALENILRHTYILRELPGEDEQNWPKTEKGLRKILGAKNKVKRIEGYDVSNIQGRLATGSMVVFENGEPKRKEYRKFRIKIAGEPNDTAMLREILSRRFQHPEWTFPQLILIDGGKTQLSAALNVKTKSQMPALPAGKSKLKDIKIMAIAKRKNELFIEEKKKPVLLKNLPQEISNLILHLRDEAHRFAIVYHKKLRKKAFIK